MKLSRRSAQALIIVSAAALLIGGWSAAQLRLALARGPLLVEPFSIAVDSDGRIFCGVDGDRIHAYAPDGKLENVWSVPAGGLPFRIRLDESGLGVATQMGRVHRFSRSGDLVETREDASAYTSFGAANDTRFEASDGRVYAIGWGIVRSDATGSEQLVEPVPAPLRFFYPIPILLVPVMFLGVFGLIAGVVGSPGTARRRE